MDLIVMLTHNDQTVSNAIELFEQCKNLPVQHWGFKNIGLPVDKMKLLVKAMKDCGKTTYLEVVTYSEEECMDAAKLAVECGFDCLMGTLYYPSVGEYVRGKIKYYPFCGHVWSNPSILGDDIEGIIEDAKRLQALGVDGVDLLAYRFVGDAEKLLEEFLKEVSLPTVVAGSINSRSRLNRMYQLNPAGFTCGSALFVGDFVIDGDFYSNLAGLAHKMELIEAN